jgi:hypothetical protein
MPSSLQLLDQTITLLEKSYMTENVEIQRALRRKIVKLMEEMDEYPSPIKPVTSKFPQFQIDN